MHTIDVNCDMGEGAGNDAQIMPFISSANIACGYHAGDETTMKKTVELALLHGVAVGAHPGFADKQNFGRLPVMLPLQQVYQLVAEQVYSLQNIARSVGATLHHVKPHGALYNMAAADEALAAVIAGAVKAVDENLVLYGLYNSYLITAAQQAGLRTAAEVFADRRYHNNGTLVSRAVQGAVIEEEEKAIEQVLNMALHNTVTSIEGDVVTVQPQTICLHGDGQHAAVFARLVHIALAANNILVKAV
jgi:UPF0271 protein